jgi:DNA-binding response OmpR family regulator
VQDVGKQNLLLVDADQRSLQVLEVSLRKSGYSVTTAETAQQALDMLAAEKPDLVLCDTRLPHMDGFAFIEAVRQKPELAEVPLIVLSSDMSVASKVRGLKLGVEDYLTKPIYIKEVLARVGVVLQRKRREGIALRGRKQKFTGSLLDIGVVDLLQTIDNSKKSGVLHLSSAAQEGEIYFRNGNPIDAELGSLRGARAIYRALVFSEGEFEIDFRDVTREDAIQTPTQAVLIEGMRRLDEWGRALDTLPELGSVLEVSEDALFARLAEIPDEHNPVLRQIDGRRSILQIVDACEQEDVESITSLAKLYGEGVLLRSERRASLSATRELTANDQGQELLGTLVLPQGASSSVPAASPSWRARAHEAEAALRTRSLAAASGSVSKAPAGAPVLPSRAPVRLSRMRKSHKRVKRLSLTSSPGLLSTLERRGGHSASPGPAREIDESQAELTPSSVMPPPYPVAEQGAVIEDAPTTKLPSLAPRASERTSPTPPPLPAAVQERSASQRARDLARAKEADNTPVSSAESRNSAPEHRDAHRPVPKPSAGDASIEPSGDSKNPPAPSRPAPEARRDSEKPATNGVEARRESDKPAPRSDAPRESSKPPVARSDAPRESGKPAPRESAKPAAARSDAPRESAKPAAARSDAPRESAKPGRESAKPAHGRESARPSQGLTRVGESVRPSLGAPVTSGSTLPPRRVSRGAVIGWTGAIAIAALGVVAFVTFSKELESSEPREPAAQGTGSAATSGSPIIGETPRREANDPDPASSTPAPEGAARDALRTEAADSERSIIGGGMQPSSPDKPGAATTSTPAPAAATEAPSSAAVSGGPTASGAAKAGKTAATPSDAHTPPGAGSVLERGQKLEAQGKRKQAVTLYETLRNETPPNSPVLSRLAYLYLYQTRNAEAADVATRAVEADSTNSEGWIVLGAAKSTLGDREGARNAYKKCAEQGRGSYVAECRRMLR